MAANTRGDGLGSRHRIGLWGTAALVLLLPWLAMRINREINWDGVDFAVLAIMLLGACGAFELAARVTGSTAYRAGVCVALATTFILVSMNLAVGLIGSEDNPANLMYVGVLAVGFTGAGLARLRAGGMAITLVAAALAQVAAGLVALIAGWGSTGANWPAVIVVLTAFFAALWLG